MGYRPGIYDTWADAKKQVFDYSGAVHQKFKQLQDAFDFLRDNRCIPPSVRQLWPVHTPTPEPPPHYYEAERRYHAISDSGESSEIKDLATETPNPCPIPLHAVSYSISTQPTSQTEDPFYIIDLTGAGTQYRTASYGAEVHIIDLTGASADTQPEAQIVLECGS